MRKRGVSAVCFLILLLLAVSVSAQDRTGFNRTVALNVQEYSGYIIEFDELPVIAYRKSIEKSGLQSIDALAKSHREKISLQHDNAKNEILKRLDRKSFASKGSIALLGEYSDVFNGIALNLSDGDAEKIKDLPGVRKMHPNVAVRTALMESVPLMKADAVWQLSDSNGNSVTGKNVTIAIIDTGVDYTHPDLGGCIGAGCRVIGGYDFFNKDSNPMDDNGHGTHVAATAAGSGTLPDGRAIKGVAPDAKIMAYKVLSSGGSGYASDIIAAIERSTDPNQDGNFADHVDIISMSLGGSGNPNDPMSAAVDSASDIGVLSVIAAGNSGPNYYTVSSPGTARRAVTIAAADKSDLIASFSSRGPTNFGTMKPDIAAPGVLICAARTPVFTPWTSNPSYAICGGDNKRVLLSGTSMATPHVAGAAALIKQMHPDWKPEQIKNAMKSSSRDLGSDVYTQGAGRIDALAAYQVTIPPLSAGLSSIPSSYCTRNQIIVSGFVNGSNLAPPYVFEYGSGLMPSSWTQISSSSVLGNHSFAFNSTGLSGKYAIRLRAKNSFGNTSEDRIVANLKDLPCKPGFPYTKWYGNDWIHVNGPAVGDFDNDGKKEIALHASIDRENGSVFVVGSNGALKFGWPRYGISWADSSVAAGDIDNNGDLEIVAVGRGYNVFRPSNFSRVFIYNHDGSGFNSSTGFFGQVRGDALLTDAVLDDLDNDGKIEVIVPSSGDSVFSTSDIYVWKGSGQGYIRSNGSFSSAEYGFRSSPAIGDLNGDGRQDIVAGNNYNRTFAWNSSGSGLLNSEGYFKELFFTQRSPALADLDNNGDLEIIFGQTPYGSSIWGSSPGALHVLNHDGTNFAGFPQNVNNMPMSSPAVGDIDGDGYAEIILVISGAPAKVFAFRKDGSIVAGWPFVFGSENPTYSPPTIADIDGDGTQEIMLATIVNNFPAQPQYTTQIFILNNDGTVQKKYDNIEDCFNFISPVIPADIDGDGKTELVFSCFGLFGLPTVGNAVINVHAFDLGTPLGKIEWQTEHHDFRHTGLYVPSNQTIPSPPSLNYSLACPTVPCYFTANATPLSSGGPYQWVDQPPLRVSAPYPYQFSVPRAMNLTLFVAYSMYGTNNATYVKLDGTMINYTTAGGYRLLNVNLGVIQPGVHSLEVFAANPNYFELYYFSIDGVSTGIQNPPPLNFSKTASLEKSGMFFSSEGMDFDSDAKPEFILVHGIGLNGYTLYYNVSFYESPSDNVYSNVNSFADSALSKFADFGDSDADGRRELLTGRSIQEASGTYPSVAKSWENPILYSKQKFADLDNDNKIEVIAFGGSNITLYENTGNNAYARVLSLPVPQSNEPQCIGIMDDLDNNGKKEVVVGFKLMPGIYPNDKVRLAAYESNGDNSLKELWKGDMQYYTSGMIEEVSCNEIEYGGDLDGDGKKEFVVGGSFIYHYKIYSVFESDTVKTFRESAKLKIPVDNYGKTSMKTADLDTDGKKEIIITVENCAYPDSVIVYKNKADNEFSRVWNISWINPQGWLPDGMANPCKFNEYLDSFAVGDFDRDGKHELIFDRSDSFANETVVYELATGALPAPPSPSCGNGICESGENSSSCFIDCKTSSLCSSCDSICLMPGETIQSLALQGSAASGYSAPLVSSESSRGFIAELNEQSELELENGIDSAIRGSEKAEHELQNEISSIDLQGINIIPGSVRKAQLSGRLDDVRSELEKLRRERSGKISGHKARLAAEHNSFRNKVEGQKIRREFTKSFNGFALDISEQDAEQLKQHPEVRQVFSDKERRIDLMKSVSYINADRVWNLSDASNNKLTGKGTKIAIIDTGVDYNHADLKTCGAQALSAFSSSSGGAAQSFQSGILADESNNNVAVMYDASLQKFLFATDLQGAGASQFTPESSGIQDVAFSRISSIEASITILSNHSGFDMDHDGNREVILRRYTDIWTSVFDVFEAGTGNSLGVASVFQTLNPGSDSYYPSDVGDSDNDGLSELVIFGRTTNNFSTRIYESLTPTSYPSQLVWQLPEEWWSVGAKISDTDNDGKKEIIVAGQTYGYNHRVAIYENTGNNSYSQTFYQAVPGAHTSQGMDVADDLDNDGKKEILFGVLLPDAAGMNGVYMFESTGDNSYQQIWSVQPRAWDGQMINLNNVVYAGDMDNDGKKEFLVGGRKTIPDWGYPFWSVYQLYEANGDNSFVMVSDAFRILGGFWDNTVVNVADVDGDGRKEIIVSMGTTLKVFKNTGDNLWSEAWIYSAAGDGRSIGANDLNKNGRSEFLFAEGATGVYEASLSGSFEYCRIQGDEDNNGFADCADTSACPTGTYCSANSTYLCKSQQCVLAPQPENCRLPGDEDQDGMADCADTIDCPSGVYCDYAGTKYCDINRQCVQIPQRQNFSCKVTRGWDFFNDDNDPMDDHGHGTHVAATAAGNGALKGVAPDAEVYAYKVCSSGGSCWESDIIAGIEMSLDPNQDGDFSDRADVISISLGGGGTPDDPDAKAVDNAFNKGSFVSVAAGNSGPSYQTVLCPGCARNATTVAAWCKPEDVGKNSYCSTQIASFSSRGPVVWGNSSLDKPDIAAPGVNICAAEWDSAWSSSRCLDLSHVAISGTSMATPHVAGAAALLIQSHPEWSPQQVKEALKASAVNLGYDKYVQGAGLIDIYAAVFNNYNYSSYRDDYYYYTLQDRNCSVNITMSALSGNKTVSARFAPNVCDYSWDSSATASSGNSVVLSASGLPSGRYSVRINGTGNYNLSRVQSCLVDVTNPSINVTPLASLVSADFLLSAAVSDSNGLDRCEACVSSDGNCDSEWNAYNVTMFFIRGASQGICTFSWKVSNYSDGNYSVMMRVFDTGGNIGASQAQKSFLDKTPPQVSIVSVKKYASYNEQIPVSSRVTDNYRVGNVSVYLGTNSASMSLNPLTGLYEAAIYSPSTPGVFSLRVLARDSSGHEASSYAEVTVSEPVTWSAPVRAIAGQHNASSYDISVGSSAYLAWEESSSLTPDIFFSRILPDGTFDLYAVPVSDSVYNSRSPSVDLDGSTAYVAWQDDADGNKEIYYAALAAPIVKKRLTFNSFDSVSPKIIAKDGLLYFFWIDYRSGSRDLYFAKADTLGNKLVDDTRIASDVSVFDVAEASPVRVSWITGGYAYHALITDSVQGQLVVAPALEIGLAAGNRSMLLTSSSLGMFLHLIDGNAPNITSSVKIAGSASGIDASNAANGAHLLWNSNNTLMYAKADNNGALIVFPSALNVTGPARISGTANAMVAAGLGRVDLLSTVPLEKNLPLISVSARDVRAYSAVIVVNSSEAGFATLEFGKQSFNSSLSSNVMNMTHTLVIGDLSPASLYQLKATVTDPAGNSQSSILSFSTSASRNAPALPSIFFGRVIEYNGTPLENVQVTASWIDSNDEPRTTVAQSLSEASALALGNKGLIGYYLFNKANVNAKEGSLIMISAVDMVSNVSIPAGPGGLPFNVSSPLIVDRTPPALTIVSPASQTYPSPFLALNFTVNEPIVKAEFKLNNQDPVIVTGKEGVSINITAALGANTLTVSVVDRIGLSSSRTVSFAVDDKVPPVVVIGQLPYSRNITFIAANVSDATNSLSYCEVCAGSGCTWLTANDDFDPGDMKGTCSYSWDSNLVADGLHSIAIRAYDAYNNIGYSSPLFTTVDNTPLANTSFNATPVKKDQRVSIKWSKSSEPDFRRYIVYRSQSPPEAIAVMLNADQTSFDDVAVASGQTYKYAVVAEDLAGNVNMISFTQVTVSDFIPPNITIFSPRPILYSSKSVPLTFYSSEPLGGCEYGLNGQRTYIFGNTTLIAQEGNNSLFLSCNDTSHNPGNASVLFMVDTTPPAIISASVYPVPKKNELNISWAASNAADFSYYSVYRSSSPFASASQIPEIARIGSRQVRQYTDSGLVSQQAYYYAVTATDSLGNENKSVISAAGIVSDNVKPSVSIISPSPSVYNSSLLYLQYAATEPLSWCGYSLNSGNLAEVSNNSLVSPSEGSNILILYCNDTSDNQGTVSVNFDVNAAIPKNPAVTVTSVLRQNALSLSWQPASERDFASYSIYRSQAQFSIAVPENRIASVSSPQYTDSGLSSQQNYYYAVTIVDKYGSENISVASVKGTVVDTAKPVLSVTSPLPQVYKSPVQIQYSVNEPLAWCGYSLNSGSMAVASNNSAIAALEGANVLVLYCNDTSNNQESVSVAFDLDLSAPQNVKVNVTPVVGQNSLVISWIPSTVRDLASHKVYRGTSSFSSPAQASLIASVPPSASQYADTGLQSQSVYYYALSSVDKYGNENTSLASVPGTVADTVAPAPIVSTASAVPRNISLKIDWTKSAASDFYNYNVYRSQAPFDNIASATRIASILSKNTLSYADFGVQSQLTYYYAVAANDTAGNENSSVTSASATVYDLVPPQLSILTPANTTYNSRQLTLQISVNEPSDCSFRLNNGNSSPISSSMAFTAAEGGNRVVVTCSDLSLNSANASLLFGTDTIPPSAIAILNVSPVRGQNVLSLRWNSSADSDLASYAVYRSPSFFTSTSQAARLLTTASLNYNDSNLASQQTYYYAVAAIDRAGNENGLVSPKSGTVADTVPPLPVALSVSPVAGKAMLSLSWSKAPEPDLSYYAIYRSSAPFANASQASRIAASASESYNDAGLKSETMYYYAVTAVDFEGNENPLVPSVGGRTADITPPNVTIISPQNKTYAAREVQLQYSVTEPSSCEYSLGSGFSPASATIAANEGGNILRMNCADSSGNLGNASLAFSTDTLPPAPVRISAVQVPRKEQVNLSWQPVDDAGFDYYTIYRSSTPFTHVASASPIQAISSRTQASFVDSSVKSEGLYYYAINAMDAMGNVNSTVESYYVAVEDLTPPVISISSPVPRTYSEYSVPLAFSSNEPVANCSIVLNSQQGNASASLTASEGSNSLTVSCQDLNFNVGTAAVSFNVNAQAPPQIPVSAAWSNGALLSWPASPVSDLKHYAVYRSNAPFSDSRTASLIGTTTATSFRDVNVESQALYYYAVAGVDIFNHENTSVIPKEFIVPDIAAPAPVLGLEVGQVIGEASLILTWQPSPENDVAGYSIYRSPAPFTQASPSFLISSVQNVSIFIDTGLESSTSYHYAVVARDMNGNENLKVASVMGTTYDVSPPNISVEQVPSPVSGQVMLRALVYDNALSRTCEVCITQDVCSWQPASSNFQEGDRNGSCTFAWQAPVTGGIYMYSFRVSDAAGNRHEGQLLQAVLANISDVRIFTMPLYAGWNLVSFPVIPENNSVRSVLSSVSGNYTRALFYDAYTESWQSHFAEQSIFNPEETLLQVDLGKGYWVELRSNSSLTINGARASTYNSQLQAGWNLIGSPYDGSVDMGLAASSLNSQYYALFSYNATEQKWERYSPYPTISQPNTIKMLHPGAGYMIDMIQASPWNPQRQ